MLRILALTLLIVLSMPPVAMGGQADLILFGGRVLTMDSDRQLVEAVAITGGEVRALGSNQEIQRLSGPQTRTVDLRGRTVIPGLIDAHVHLLLAQQIVDEASLKDYQSAVLPQTLMGFLQHGITTVRSATDPWPHIAEVRDQLEKGTLKGPRLVIVGPSLTAPNGHPIPAVCRTNLFCRDRAVREVATEEDARQAVGELTQKGGVDQVKVVVDHVQSPTLSGALLSAIVDESHRSGRQVIAHASGGAKTSDSMSAGFDELVHTPWSAGQDTAGLAAVLVAGKTRVTTTVSIFDAYSGSAGSEFFVFGGTYNPGIRQVFEVALKTVRAFADAGVTIVLGTDWYDDPLPIDDGRARAGARTLHEMELLRRAGLSTSAILTAATRNAAEALGILDTVGTITAGKVADLVIVDGDPLQDLQVLQRPVVVLQGGRVVHGAFPER